MMYICNHCDQTVRPIIKTTYESFSGGNDVEIFTEAICPVCGSQDLSPADLCPVCHNWMEKGRDCCKECGGKARQTLSDALSQLDPEQIKYLDYELDGVSLLDFWNES